VYARLLLTADRPISGTQHSRRALPAPLPDDISTPRALWVLKGLVLLAFPWPFVQLATAGRVDTDKIGLFMFFRLAALLWVVHAESEVWLQRAKLVS
jgi:hypothetical protein